MKDLPNDILIQIIKKVKCIKERFYLVYSLNKKDIMRELEALYKISIIRNMFS